MAMEKSPSLKAESRLIGPVAQAFDHHAFQAVACLAHLEIRDVVVAAQHDTSQSDIGISRHRIRSVAQGLSRRRQNHA